MQIISIRKKLVEVIPILVFFLVFCPFNYLISKELPASIVSILQQDNIPTNTLSIIIEEVNSDISLVDINSKRYRNPGSLSKLFTSFVALDYFGKEKQWQTKVYASDSIDDGIVDKLLIVGGGDPFLKTKNIIELIGKLREMGIHTIQNGLLVDQSMFPKGTIKPDDFDNDPLRPYNLIHASLIANFNTIDFTIKKSKFNNEVDIEYDFLPDGIYLNNSLKIGTGICSHFRDQVVFNQLIQESFPPSIIIEVVGEYPENCDQYIHDIAITETNHFFFGLFSYLWKESGGKISGYIHETSIEKSEDPLLNYYSIELSDLMPYLLKDSNNFIARQIFFSLGKSKYDYNLRKSRQVIKEVLKKNNIRSKRNFYDNGSGLSRTTKIRPDTLSNLLKVIYHHPSSNIIIPSLPISGVDGTLSNRFNSPLLKEKMRLKTGTLNGVRGFAGYITGISGKEYTLVYIHNDQTEHSYETKRFEKALFEWIVDDLNRVL